MRSASLLVCVALSACRAAIGLPDDAGIACELEPGAHPDRHACRVVAPQCGCEPDQACRLDIASAARSCSIAGAVEANGRCASPDDCVAGTMCFALTTGLGHCLPFCLDGSDCARELNERSPCFYFEEYTAGICQHGCRPGRDDEDCGDGLACDFVPGDNAHTLCRPVGPAGLGEDCGGAFEMPCARGSSCTAFPSGMVCVPLCGPGLPDCAEGLTCVVSTSATEGREARVGEWGTCFTLTSS